METVKYANPSKGDDRYPIFIGDKDPSRDQFISGGVCGHLGWARKIPTGFEFYRSLDCNDPGVPKDLTARTMKELLATVQTSLANTTPEDKLMAKFMDLATLLSPENLTCDGMVRGKALARKEAALRKQWTALEAQIGRPVTETETWDWFMKQEPRV